jgi:hypothetical protein
MQVWLVGDGLTAQEQQRAQPGVHFVPYSQFPPASPGGDTRGDCVYHSTPALVVPDSYENLHACEVTKTIAVATLTETLVASSMMFMFMWTCFGRRTGCRGG